MTDDGDDFYKMSFGNKREISDIKKAKRSCIYTQQSTNNPSLGLRTPQNLSIVSFIPMSYQEIVDK